MWATVEARWEDLIEAIQGRWPEISVQRLVQMGGDFDAFIAHLARVHDLTLREAAETVEEWLWTVNLAECSHPEDRRVLVAE